MAGRSDDRVDACPICGGTRHYFDGQRWVCVCFDPREESRLLASALDAFNDEWILIDIVQNLDTASRC